jgi:hypothetical protein
MSGMDLASAQLAAGTPSHCIDGHVLCWPGAFLPLLVPLECLSPQRRAEALVASNEVPLAVRVMGELDCGQEQRAWEQLSHLTDPLSVPTGLDTVLQLWNARAAAALALPVARTAVQIVAEPMSRQEDQQQAAKAAAEGLQAVYSLLDPWPWPRWIGPVLMICDARALPGLPAQEQQLQRPALPLVRIQLDTPRAEIARRLLRLTLALTAPPTGGWPPWLTTGLGELAAAKAESQLVSPHQMLLVRQAAGITGLTELMTSTQPDPHLSQAVACYLLHPSRSANFPSLLDLLRNGATSHGALELAYGLALTQLLDEH